MRPLPSAIAPARQASVLGHEIDIDPDWLDFGPDDPLEAERWINRCARCDALPELKFEGQAHVVRCACGAAGGAGRLPAVAAVNWNKSSASIHPDYRELPFFALHELSIPAARAKLVSVREYLEEQKRRCERRIRRREPVGHRYFQRIRAYLAWSIYGLGLVKEAEAALHETASARS